MQFDDIKVNDKGLSLQPIGTYRGLNWTGFDVIDVSLAPIGVAPVTEPNVAVQYILSESLGTTATLVPAKIDGLILQSFYFGCVASSQETDAGVPLACSLTITGTRRGKVVYTQDVSFKPDTPLVSNMAMQKIPGKVIDKVEFKQTELLAAATSVLYDNVQFLPVL